MLDWGKGSFTRCKEINVLSDAWTYRIDVKSLADLVCKYLLEARHSGLVILGAKENYSKGVLIG